MNDASDCTFAPIVLARDLTAARSMHIIVGHIEGQFGVARSASVCYARLHARLRSAAIATRALRAPAFLFSCRASDGACVCLHLQTRQPRVHRATSTLRPPVFTHRQRNHTSQLMLRPADRCLPLVPYAPLCTAAFTDLTKHTHTHTYTLVKLWLPRARRAARKGPPVLVSDGGVHM